MAAATVMGAMVSVTGTLVPAPETSDTIGVPAILTADTLEGGGAGSYMAFGSATAIAAALAATEISSTTAAWLTAALGQDARPPFIYVITYGVGAPYDALVLALQDGLDVGLVTVLSATESVLATFATALSGGDFASRILYVAQSADTGLYGTPPSSLASLAYDFCRLFYSPDDDLIAAAYVGRLAGTNLGSARVGGPAGARVRILGVDALGLTEPQQAAMLANNVSGLFPKYYGSAATERMTLGEKSYSGVSWSAAVTVVYVCRQVWAAIGAMILEMAIEGRPIFANADGENLVSSRIIGVVGPLAKLGFFTPVAAAAEGYTYTVVKAEDEGGAYLTAEVTMYIAREPYRFSVTSIGREV